MTVMVSEENAPEGARSATRFSKAAKVQNKNLGMLASGWLKAVTDHNNKHNNT
jgi:hypothetical protein